MVVVWTGAVEGDTEWKQKQCKLYLCAHACMFVSGTSMDLSPGVGREVITLPVMSVMASESVAVEEKENLLQWRFTKLHVFAPVVLVSDVTSPVEVESGK